MGGIHGCGDSLVGSVGNDGPGVLQHVFGGFRHVLSRQLEFILAGVKGNIIAVGAARIHGAILFVLAGFPFSVLKLTEVLLQFTVERFVSKRVGDAGRYSPCDCCECDQFPESLLCHIENPFHCDSVFVIR